MIYNICDGGPGGQTHDISGINNPQYGRVWTDEQKEILSAKLKGRKKPDGFSAKISAQLIGKKKSPEHIAKRSHPIDVLDIQTGNVLHFTSKSEMERILKCNSSTILRGGLSHKRYKLYKR